MIEAVLNLVPPVAWVAIMAIWIHALANWDGARQCDHNCDACPFPKTRECQDDERRTDK